MFAVGMTAEEVLTGSLAAAIVVMCGGFYALFLTLANMHQRLRDRILAYTNFLAVCAAYLILAQALHMSKEWQAVVALLLLAYLISPHLIWKLTRGTHLEPGKGGSDHD